MSFYYLSRGYRVRVSKHSKYDHWQGGKAYHQGAKCKGCRLPLLLLWDINCQDPRFTDRSERPFGQLKRLPLYYCWRCAGNFSYQVIVPEKIKIIESNCHYQGDDFPYTHFPSQFDRCPIVLEPIPLEVYKLLVIAQELEANSLSTKEKRKVTNWQGRNDRHFELWRHQFGGLPYLIQGHEIIRCPNKNCKRSGNWIKELAVIHNDPYSGLPMIETLEEARQKGANHWVQVVFHICSQCLTIYVSNRCD